MRRAETTALYICRTASKGWRKARMSLVGIDKALRAAPPDRLVETLDAYLSAAHSVKSSTVWLADYRSTTLAPTGFELPGAGDVQLASATRAFASQTSVLEGGGGQGMVRLHLPLSAWGERVGVLSVGLDADRVPA